MDVARGDVTQLLQQWSDGHEQALDQLIPQIHDELRKLAASYLRRERPDHTLQPTAINPPPIAANLIGRNGLPTYSVPFVDSMQMPLAAARTNPVVAIGMTGRARAANGTRRQSPSSRRSRTRIPPNSDEIASRWVRFRTA